MLSIMAQALAVESPINLSRLQILSGQRKGPGNIEEKKITSSDQDLSELTRLIPTYGQILIYNPTKSSNVIDLARAGFKISLLTDNSKISHEIKNLFLEFGESLDTVNSFSGLKKSYDAIILNSELDTENFNLVYKYLKTGGVFFYGTRKNSTKSGVSPQMLLNSEKIKKIIKYINPMNSTYSYLIGIK